MEMRKIQTLFIGIGLVAAIVVVATAICERGHNAQPDATEYSFPETQYGAFLAAQHAIYVNDFENAARFSATLTDTEHAVVQNTKLISEFLNGKLPDAANVLKNEKNAAAQLIYDAYLVNGGAWKELYNRHGRDEAALSAPFRIWSAVATNRRDNAFRYIKKLKTNPSWQSFVRGQIYATCGDVENAAKEFAAVDIDFININDYVYLMSFYRNNDLPDAATKLHDEFTARPGGMFLAGFDDFPGWDTFSGYKNALAFSLVQSVSHTQVMMYSDLAVMLLRFAQITAPEYGKNDAIDYYLGQYFFHNSGNWHTHFNKINRASPFYSFAAMRRAEGENNINLMRQIVDENPLFVTALNKLIAHYVKTGDMNSAIKVINRALENENISDTAHAFFLKGRAQIYLVFQEYTNAQADIRAAADVLAPDPEIVSIQAKIWAAQNREIENAYDYAMALIRQNPTDVMAWDTLGCVVLAREGIDAAIDIWARVGDATGTNSGLFEHLGDAYVAVGDAELARDAYMRAIALADDGFTVVPRVENKLRKLK